MDIYEYDSLTWSPGGKMIRESIFFIHEGIDATAVENHAQRIKDEGGNVIVHYHLDREPGCNEKCYTYISEVDDNG